jgi:hypothetical protein
MPETVQEGDIPKCGKPAASFIPRLGMSFACVRDLGHEGDCQQGGTCFKHGSYIGQQCPQWPSCISETIEPQWTYIRSDDDLPKHGGQVLVSWGFTNDLRNGGPFVDQARWEKAYGWTMGRKNVDHLHIYAWRDLPKAAPSAPVESSTTPTASELMPEILRFANRDLEEWRRRCLLGEGHPLEEYKPFDRCDDPSHHSRDNCPYCLGSGSPAELKAEGSTK